MSSVAQLSQDHQRANCSFRSVIGGLDTLRRCEDPQRLGPSQEAPTATGDQQVLAAHTASQRVFHTHPQVRKRLLQRRPSERAATKITTSDRPFVGRFVRVAQSICGTVATSSSSIGRSHEVISVCNLTTQLADAGMPKNEFNASAVSRREPRRRLRSIAVVASNLAPAVEVETSAGSVPAVVSLHFSQSSRLREYSMSTGLLRGISHT